eukprot:1829365-Rhodomonas_salina.1
MSSTVLTLLWYYQHWGGRQGGDPPGAGPVSLLCAYACCPTDARTDSHKSRHLPCAEQALTLGATRCVDTYAGCERMFAGGGRGVCVNGCASERGSDTRSAGARMGAGGGGG